MKNFKLDNKKEVMDEIEKHRKAIELKNEQSEQKNIQMILKEAGVIELENQILRETLQISSQNSENLIAQSNIILEKMREFRKTEMQELAQHVKSIQNSNEILETEVNKVLEGLADDIKDNLIGVTELSISENSNKITKFVNEQLSTMERVKNSYERNQIKLLESRKLQNIMFWVFGISLSLLTLEMLVIFVIWIWTLIF